MELFFRNDLLIRSQTFKANLNTHILDYFFHSYHVLISGKNGRQGIKYKIMNSTPGLKKRNKSDSTGIISDQI